MTTGGYSGGSLERPALRRPIVDVEEGLVDVIVIYKLDRLTRSLADFIRLIDVLGANGTTFTSVTLAFDTRDTPGRLVVNILLTFAPFEREMIADPGPRQDAPAQACRSMDRGDSAIRLLAPGQESISQSRGSGDRT